MGDLLSLASQFGGGAAGMGGGGGGPTSSGISNVSFTGGSGSQKTASGLTSTTIMVLGGVFAAVAGVLVWALLRKH